jgi:hypothetical protein
MDVSSWLEDTTRHIFSNMDDNLIFGLDFHPDRRSSNFILITCFVIFLLDLSDCVYPIYAEDVCNT